MKYAGMSRFRSPRQASRGFTLAEMMTVVVIVAVLMGIGLPSYQNAMQKGRRTDAKEALMSVANRQEQLMLDRSTYSKDLTGLGFDVTVGGVIISGEGHYAIASIVTADCAEATTTCYVLRATPVAGDPQKQDSGCTSFTLTNKGAQQSTGATQDSCW